MPTCIYCRAQTTGKEGLPALNATSAITTSGASWSRTYTAIPAWPSPSSLGIHGKKGLRKRLSTIERTDEGKTQASGHSLKIETDKEGRRTSQSVHR